MQKQTSISLKSKIRNAMRKFDWRDYFKPNFKMIAILPYITVAAILIITPMVMLLVKATNTEEHREAAASIAKDQTTWDIIGRSVYLGLAAAVIALVLTFPFTYIVARSKSKTFKTMSTMLVISPLFIFTIAKVFALKIILIKMFGGNQAIQNQGVMIAGMVYLYMPFMIIPLYSVLQQMPSSLIEASNDLGYNRIVSIIRVVIPYALKAIFASLAIMFMLSATTLVISGSLVGTAKSVVPALTLVGNKIDTLAISMRQNELDAAKGSFVALVTIAVMMSVYTFIYAGPIIYRKIRGGVNV